MEELYPEEDIKKLYPGIDINRFCFYRREKGLSYPACCKNKECQEKGKEKCDNPMYILKDGVFIDYYMQHS